MRQFFPTTQLQSQGEAIIAQPLTANPLYQLLEDRAGLFCGFNGGATTDSAAYLLTAPASFLLLGRNQPPTIGAMRKLMLMLFTETRAPMIDQVFFHQWSPTVSTTGRDGLVIALNVIWSALILLKMYSIDGTTTGSTNKMLWMPASVHCCEIVA
jgi:hypothetical protein